MKSNIGEMVKNTGILVGGIGTLIGGVMIASRLQDIMFGYWEEAILGGVIILVSVLSGILFYALGEMIDILTSIDSRLYMESVKEIESIE